MTKCNVFISFVLSFVIVLNCNVYRRDTYAFAPAIPIVVGGEVVLELTAAAFAALAGAVVGMAITPDSGTVTDTEKIVSDFLVYDVVTNGSAHTVEMLEDTGFMVEVDESGVSVVDVPGSRVGTFTGYYSDGEFYFGDMSTGNGDLSGGSPPEPEQGPGLGKRLLAGFMAAASGLGSIGASFYDYLHNSDSVEYVPASDFVADSFYNIRSDCYSVQQELAASLLSYSFDTSSRDPFYYTFNNSLTGAAYIDMYYMYNSAYDDTKPKSKLLGFAFLITYPDNKCEIYTTCIIYYPENGYLQHYLSAERVSDCSTSDVFDKSFSIGWHSTRGFATLGDYTFVGHYVNTDVVGVDELPDSASEQLKIGDTVYNITQGDNIYNNQQYITQQISDKQDRNGNVLITAPSIDREANTISYPKYITYEGDEVVYGDTITYLNPDTMEVDDDVQLSDEDYTNKNIFQLLYNFCTNFWTKFKQSLGSVFISDTELDFSGFSESTDRLKRVFPFSVPWDILSSIELLKADPKAPIFEISLWAPGEDGTMFGIPLTEEDMTVVIDLTEYESIFAFIRWFEILAFCFALALISRHIVGET